MARAAKLKHEKMIKVDHAGENGAVNIYRAQGLALRLRKPSLVSHVHHFQAHEEEHRAIFSKYLAENNIRRCVSYHLCGIGGFTLGFVTGLIGPNAVHATTFAVEHVVLTHPESQLEYLKKTDPQACAAVTAIIRDEQEHHDDAHDRLDPDSKLAKILISIVRICTEGVIKFGMR